MSVPVTAGDFAEYRLVRLLGQGAMGQVFLGHDTVLDRPVAIKLIRGPMAGSQARQRFLIEGRAIARLLHPNVVTVFRVGENQGQPYLVSEYVAGTNLAELPTPLPWPEALDIAVGLCRGLAAAHRRGVFHRDIKPANAILADSGEVKLLDFGLAKLAADPEFPVAAMPPASAATAATEAIAGPVATAATAATRPTGPGESGTTSASTLPSSGEPDETALAADATASHFEAAETGGQPIVRSLWDQPAAASPVLYATASHAEAVAADATPEATDLGGLTETGSLLGTPLYMAPEAWKRLPATAQTDLYSLGALLYQLVSARPPHAGLSTSELAAVVGELAPRPVAELCPDIEPRFAALIDRCLRRDPGERPGSADELCDSLEEIAREPADEPLPEQPYRGLRPFGAEHRAFFYGRSLDVRAVIDLIRSEPAVVVAGDSGVGKSSLCRAGVLPRITGEGVRGADAVESGRTYSLAAMVPGGRPLDALAEILAEAVGAPAGSVAAHLAEQPAAAVRALRRALGKQRGLVVFVDQLEELVTLADARQAEPFAAGLGALAAWAPGIRVLATARGDFLTRLAAIPALGPLLGRGLYLLGPLAPRDLRQAITGPARRLGFEFESAALVDELVRAGVKGTRVKETRVKGARSIGSPDAPASRLRAPSSWSVRSMEYGGPAVRSTGGLPLLSFALRELWQARDRDRRLIPARALDDIGGVIGALARHAETVLARLRPAERQAAQQVLVALVTTGGNSARRREDELVGGRRASETRVAIDALIRGRLVVARESEDGGATYELAHEALITGWNRLQGWLDRDADRRALVERIDAAAAEWRRLARPRDALWRRRQLAEVSTAGVEPDELADHAAEFIARSRRAARRSRALAIAALVLIPLLLVAVYAGVSLRADEQRDRRIVAHTGRAAQLVDEGRERDHQAGELRRQAFAEFDHGRLERGEAIWARARKSAAVARQRYGEAAGELEVALLVEPRASVRAQLARVLYHQALLAETERDRERQSELLTRLAAYDDGTLAATWNRPASLTVTTTPPGAFVELRRYEDRDGYRALGPVIRGATGSWDSVTVDPGSYLLEIRDDGMIHPADASASRVRAPWSRGVRSGWAPVRYPIALSRGETYRVNVALVPAAAVPEAFVYIPAGRFLLGTDHEDRYRRDVLHVPPIHAVETGPYLISRTEVTVRQWLAFVRASREEARAARLPRARNYAGASAVIERADGTFVFEWQPPAASAASVLTADQPLVFPDRQRARAQVWLDLPVFGVSWDDARAYAAWLDQQGTVPGARLCTEREWERAARGADDRRYPHGDVLAPADANHDATYGRQPLAYGPDEVGSHPRSDSPFGVSDMAGNVWEWVRAEGEEPGVYYRGGGWYEGHKSSLSANREPANRAMRDIVVGFRVCADLPGDAIESR